MGTFCANCGWLRWRREAGVYPGAMRKSSHPHRKSVAIIRLLVLSMPQTLWNIQHWEANRCPDFQWITHLIRKGSVHNCAHESARLGHFLSKMNPVHTLSSYSFNVTFNIAFFSMPRCAKWSHSFRLSFQNTVGLCISIHVHTAYATCFAHLNQWLWGLQMV